MSLKLGFLFQGECKQESLPFLYELYATLKKNCHDFFIVVSCWGDDKYSNIIAEKLNLLDKDRVKITVNQKPVISGARNINLQAQSCAYGIKELERMLSNDDLVVKCRLDQAFSIDSMMNYIEQFKNSKKGFMALDIFTRRRVPFHLGDMILCMPLSSHKNYWTLESFSYELEYLQWLNGSECSVARLTDRNLTKCIPEVRLLTEYLKKQGQSSFTLKDWYNFLKNDVFLMSSEKLCLFSFKSNNFCNKKTVMAATYFSPIQFRVSPIIVECVEEDEKLYELSVLSVKILNAVAFLPYIIMGMTKLIMKRLLNLLKMAIKFLINLENSSAIK
ncbi:hypothetical protein [Pseudoalteromonas sp.]|uniref:hypothetical protein n=1 Tax=Pseudoalteromonas sp. TaxID=53249 RepID=UPI003564E970